MNKLATTLLSGAALFALTTAPAMAGNARTFQIFALHAGRVVSKTILRDPHRICVCESVSAYASIPASDLHKTVKVPDTYYKWSDNDDICTTPEQEVKLLTKKTAYAKIGTATETYSEGCSSGPTTFYGDTYKLTNPAGEGQSDYYRSNLVGRFTDHGLKYRGGLLLVVHIEIGK